MSIDLAQRINSGTVLWEAFLDIGNAYRKQSKFKEAKKSYQESIAVIENIRSNIEIEELKASYFGSNKRLESYYNLLDLLAKEYSRNRDIGTGNEAFEFLEKAKARAFLDSLEVSQVDISQGIDIRLANREKQIDRELTTLYKKTLTPNLPKEQLDEIEKNIGKSEDELDKLKREIRSSSPAYADLKYPEIITLKEVRENLLDSQTAIIAFSVGKESSYGFAVTRDIFSIYPISSRKLLQDQVASYLKIVSDKDARDFSLGANLFSELIGPDSDPRLNASLSFRMMCSIIFLSKPSGTTATATGSSKITRLPMHRRYLRFGRSSSAATAEKKNETKISSRSVIRIMDKSRIRRIPFQVP